MTLDEAIIHVESKALEKSREADNCFNYEGPWYEEKRACANEHKQLAEWLKELKVYRETVPSIDKPQKVAIEDCVNRYSVLAELDPRSYEYKTVKKLPSAIPIRLQGKWINKGNYAECSNCGTNSKTQFDGVELVPCKTNFCPNCGAKMK